MSSYAPAIPLSSAPQLAGSYMAPRYDPSLPTNYRPTLSWLLEAIQEGEAFNKQQLAYQDFDRAVTLICGAVEEKLPRKLSNISVNRIKRNIREMVAILSNLRPFWGYETGNDQYDSQAELYNKLMQSWYSDCFVDLSIKEALQYAAVQGTGYLLVDWDPNYWGGDRGGDISLRAKSPKDVLLVQLPESRNLQHAYATIIREEVPITLAYSRWPEFKHLLRPDRYETQRGMAKAILPFYQLITGTRRSHSTKPSAPWPTVDIYYAYVNDVSYNDSPAPMLVGRDTARGPAFTVPPVGSLIPDGLGNLRKATPRDCLLFPDRRLIIGTQTCILYDGPSFYIHGQSPIIKFTLDEWVWDFLGFSLIRDVASIQRSRNSIMRAIDDSANVRLRPPMVFDKSSVDKDKAERFDPRQPGQKMMADFQLGGDKVVSFPIPPNHWDVPQWIISNFLPYLDETTDFMMGMPGVKELAKAKQVPNSDSIEKFLEMSGSIAQDMARSMERSIRSLGQIALGDFIQFYPLARRCKVLGRDGITEEDFDIKPGDMVPAEEGLDFLTRARRHYRRFTYRVTPNSMSQMQSMSRRLLYAQLGKSGLVPIDPWTMAELNDIPNYGKPPKGTNTVMERWTAWQEMQAELQGRLQAQAQAVAAQANPLEAILGALGASGAGGAGGNGSGNPVGRPPSFSEAPAMESRPDMSTTVTTS